MMQDVRRHMLKYTAKHLEQRVFKRHDIIVANGLKYDRDAFNEPCEALKRPLYRLKIFKNIFYFIESANRNCV